MNYLFAFTFAATLIASVPLFAGEETKKDSAPQEAVTQEAPADHKDQEMDQKETAKEDASTAAQVGEDAMDQDKSVSDPAPTASEEKMDGANAPLSSIHSHPEQYKNIM